MSSLIVSFGKQSIEIFEGSQEREVPRRVGGRRRRRKRKMRQKWTQR